MRARERERVETEGGTGRSVRDMHAEKGDGYKLDNSAREPEFQDLPG